MKDPARTSESLLKDMMLRRKLFAEFFCIERNDVVILDVKQGLGEKQ